MFGAGQRRACLAEARERCEGDARRRKNFERVAVGGLVWSRRLALSERSESKGGSNSVVESQPSKLLVAGSIPVSRSSLRHPKRRANFVAPRGGSRCTSATQTDHSGLTGFR